MVQPIQKFEKGTDATFSKSNAFPLTQQAEQADTKKKNILTLCIL